MQIEIGLSERSPIRVDRTLWPMLAGQCLTELLAAELT